jgi:hypothetical protein
VAAYVWDYAGGLALRATFWEAAIALDPAAAEHDERARYPICRPDQLSRMMDNAGLHAVENGSIEITAEFRDFDDYWQPFLAGYGPASAYLLALPEAGQAALRERLRAELSPGDGPFQLPVRALSVRGVK